MKFQKTVNIWGLGENQIKALQPGQWVSAGPVDADRMNTGVFCGVRPSGSVVVMWQGNAVARTSRSRYRKSLMNYARGQA